MTTNTPTPFTERDLAILVEEYITQQRGPFSFHDLCAYIVYWGIEERQLASHQLSDSDSACVSRILQRIQREGRLRGVSGEEQLFVRALE